MEVRKVEDGSRGGSYSNGEGGASGLGAYALSVNGVYGTMGSGRLTDGGDATELDLDIISSDSSR